jgi:hypothetical protein
MSKIILEYNESTGQITDALGVMPVLWIGLKGFESETSKLSVSSVVKLKEAGFTAEEIVELIKGDAL